MVLAIERERLIEEPKRVRLKSVGESLAESVEAYLNQVGEPTFEDLVTYASLQASNFMQARNQWALDRMRKEYWGPFSSLKGLQNVHGNKDEHNNGHNGNGHEITPEMVILDEYVLERQGSFCTVERWIKGEHSGLGIIHPNGLQGAETYQITRVVRPKVIFTIIGPRETKEREMIMAGY